MNIYIESRRLEREKKTSRNSTKREEGGESATELKVLDRPRRLR